MRVSWLKTIAISVGISTLLSGLLIGLIVLATGKTGQPLKLLAIERTARVLALRGEYSQNLKLLDPIPSDGSGVLGHLWVVNPNGHVLASNTADPVPPEALSLLSGLDRSTSVPQRKKLGMAWNPKIFFFTPMPGSLQDTLVIRDLRRGPGWRLLKSMTRIFLGLSLFTTILIWGLVSWILRQRSKEVRAVMRRIASGELDARLETGRLDSFLEISSDFNEMASQVEKLFGQIQEVEKSKIELIRNLAHDIRTPLTSLQAASETLHQSAQSPLRPEDQASLIKTTHEESIYLGQLIENLLFISELNVERRGAPRQTAAINLTQLTQRQIERRQNSLKNPIVTIRLEMDEGTLWYPISELNWTRLLGNLLDNAERHARTEVSIVLRAAPEGVRLEVRDDGPGLSESALKNYGYERGSELAPESEGKGRSSRFGLGSLIIRSIVESAGGSLEVANRPSGGLEVRAQFQNKRKDPAQTD